MKENKKFLKYKKSIYVNSRMFKNKRLFSL